MLIRSKKSTEIVLFAVDGTALHCILQLISIEPHDMELIKLGISFQVVSSFSFIFDYPLLSFATSPAVWFDFTIEKKYIKFQLLQRLFMKLSPDV